MTTEEKKTLEALLQIANEVNENRKCITGAGIIAVVAFLLTLGHIVCDFVRAWS